MQDDNAEYVGFWPRVGASIIDAIIVMVITSPMLVAIYGWGTSPTSTNRSLRGRPTS